MTKDGMYILLAMVFANYPGQIKNSDATAALWMKAFWSVSEEDLTEAVFAHMARSDFAPKVSDILKLLPSGSPLLLEEESRQKFAALELRQWHKQHRKNGGCSG